MALWAINGTRRLRIAKAVAVFLKEITPENLMLNFFSILFLP
jgi:hypothetical protein